MRVDHRDVTRIQQVDAHYTERLHNSDRGASIPQPQARLDYAITEGGSWDGSTHGLRVSARATVGRTTIWGPQNLTPAASPEEESRKE